MRSPVPESVGVHVRQQPFHRFRKIQRRTPEAVDIIEGFEPPAGFVIHKILRQLRGTVVPEMAVIIGVFPVMPEHGAFHFRRNLVPAAEEQPELHGHQPVFAGQKYVMLGVFLAFIGIFARFVGTSGNVHPLLIGGIAQFVVRADGFE